MKTNLLTLLLAAGISMTCYAHSGERKPEKVVAIATENNYNVGDIVPDFKLKSTSGKTISLADYPSAKGFIIVFTCNHCPFSKVYDDRIIALNEKYAAKGFPVIAINPNDPEAYEEDSFVSMQAKAKEKNFTFPYCSDENQVVSRAFGAIRTPHVFILKRENGKNTIEYSGAIDDNAQDAAGATKHYVDDAVNNLLVGKPIITNNTKAVGCAIKWKS